jgi:hypothetical protein
LLVWLYHIRSCCTISCQLTDSYHRRRAGNLNCELTYTMKSIKVGLKWCFVFPFKSCNLI